MKEQGSGASVEFPRCFPPRSHSPALLLMPFPPANELPLCKKKKKPPARLPTPLLRRNEELGANCSRGQHGCP